MRNHISSLLWFLKPHHHLNRWICVGALVPCFGHAGPYINVAPFPSGRTSQPSGNAGGDCVVAPQLTVLQRTQKPQNPSFSSVLRSVVKGALVVFGNSTISLHILRGVLAAAAIYGSLATMSRTIWPSIILLPAAVYLMKG